MEASSSAATVNYGERWTDLGNYIVDPLDAEAARERHERGRLYAAILGDPERPWAHLDVRLEVGYVGVEFLDEQLREDLSYTFSRAPDSEGDLFLEQATWRSYDSSGDRFSAEHYIFEPPNLAHVAKLDYVADEQETSDVETDLAQNWEPVPAFGEYESIARRER